MNKSYSELMKLKTFEERYEYLKLEGKVGEETFGYDRIFNQVLYGSRIWKDDIRPAIITRDMGCDLGVEDREIGGVITVHHINPITMDDIINKSPILFDPENLICCSDATHKAIHYGDKSLLLSEAVVRTPNDTCPWKR